jgi:hypothetical protein
MFSEVNEEFEMKREVITVTVERQKRRAQFLFNDGEFRPRQEKIAKMYRRQDKHKHRREDFSF